MTDFLTRAQRSALMSKIRGKDTKPELVVQRLVHAMGFRYRLHPRDLPGAPDLVFPSRRKIIFVHGCFWHRHRECPDAVLPKTRAEFWTTKLERYVVRDRDSVYGQVFMRRLRAMGIRDRPTAPRSPWQNGHSERLIGSIRRECLDYVVCLHVMRPIIIKLARTYPSTRMRRSLALSRLLAASFHDRSWADCIIIMSGFSFRQGHGDTADITVIATQTETDQEK